MDEKALYKAAREGNTSWLEEMLGKDPMLLDRVMVMPLFTETPLHIAALAGKAEFAKQLLSQAPWLAKQPNNRHGLNALHMAAAKGHADVVTVLLDFNHELDHVVDSEGCLPLHYAAFYGRVEVVNFLVSRNLGLLQQVNLKGETALHVAIKSKQDEVTRVLVEMLIRFGGDFCDDVMMHIKDTYGHTVAQLLVAFKSKGTDLFQAYASNSRQSRGEASNNNHGIEAEENLGVLEIPADTSTMFCREAILIIMVLAATVTFQAVISPPQSLWKEGIVTRAQLKDPNNSRARYFISFLVNNSSAFFITCWGLVAALQRDDLAMLLFWLGSTLTFLLFSYIDVLKSMMDSEVLYYDFVKGLLTSISINLLISLLFYSRKTRKLLVKIRGYASLGSRGRPAATNDTNPNPNPTSSRSIVEIS